MLEMPPHWLICLPFLLLAQYWTGVNAWGTEGHSRIARMVQSILNDKQKRKIQKAMNGSLPEFANWESKLIQKYRGTEVINFHRQQPEWSCQDALHLGDKGGRVRCETSQGGAEEDSLFCTMVYFFEHFAHDALLSDFPAPNPAIDGPKNVPPLGKVAPEDMKPSRLLRGLVSLIGDLHQPLHWLRERKYGEEIAIKFRGKDFTLLSLFEDYIPQHLPFPPTEADLQKQYAEQSPAWWNKRPTLLFREWSEEVAQVLCKEVYAPLGALPQPGEQLDLPEARFQLWVSLAQNMTTWASLRTAFVLSDVLEHYKHKQLAHKEGRGHHYHGHRQTFLAGSAARSFFINVAIAGAVVPVVLGTLMWHHEHAASLRASYYTKSQRSKC